MSSDYEADDRGNVVNFYETESGDMVATLDREGEDDSGATWDGAPGVTEWALENGYEEVAKAKQI